MNPTTKNFRKRNAIYDCLCQSKAHPSAEELFSILKPQIPDLSLGTVYRNLSLFKEQGLAISVATVNGIERFDANVGPHVHFICSGCDGVLDRDEMQVPEALREAAAQCCGGRVARNFARHSSASRRSISGGESPATSSAATSGNPS